MRNVRVFSLWVLAFLGLFGNSMMLVWLWAHRKRRIRIVRLFVNLAIADVLVTLCGTLPLLCIEYLGTEWRAGEVLCKIFYFLLGFSTCASNYMMVPIAFDRCRAVKRPLALRIKVSRLTAFGWVTAFLLNIPNIVFYQEVNDDRQTVCRSVMFDWSPIYVRVVMTCMIIFIYITPLIVIITCNTRVFQQLRKSFRVYRYDNEEYHSNILRISSLGICSRSVHTTPQQSAEIRTVKLTLAIIFVFLLCEAPFCVLQLCRAYGDPQAFHSETYTILPIMSISNSSVMPFVFLILYTKFPYPGSSTRSSRKEHSRCSFVRDNV
ncbi:mesotocin receptor-like [Tachypleus tridentatus]|uniref:mesotocin receptor-like n=1 Tax=Tachypleus tridentatus TaxID=6853 RepID=UPI003FD64E35